MKLGDLGTITRGNGIKRSETRERGCPCLRYGEIYTSYNFVLDRPRSFVSKEVFDGSLHIKKNDLVFTLTGETEDEIAKTLAYLGDEEIAAGGDLAVWKDHGCDPKYLAYLMYSPGLIRAKSLASNGQIIVHISVKKFQQIEIPLPPLAVQHEIVARLEKDLAMVERMAKGFEALKAEADQLFKSTLKETFEEVSRGGAETRRLGEVSTISYGFTAKARPDDGSGAPKYLRITDIQDKAVNWSDVPVCDCNDEDYLLQSGDVVFARTGATTGKSFLISGSIPCSVFASYLIRVRLDKESKIDAKYLWYSFDTPQYWETIQGGMAGAAQGGFNSKKLAAIEVPVPPLPTQRRIVAKLDAVRERCEKLKRAAEEGLQAAALMRKAILKEAFA